MLQHFGLKKTQNCKNFVQSLFCSDAVLLTVLAFDGMATNLNVL